MLLNSILLQPGGKKITLKQYRIESGSFLDKNESIKKDFMENCIALIIYSHFTLFMNSLLFNPAPSKTRHKAL